MNRTPRLERLHALPAELEVLVTDSLAQGFPAVEALRTDWLTGHNRFDGPGEALFAARRGGELVGVCGLNVDPYLGDAQVGRVRHLYVLRGDRRCGVGRALVSRVLRHAQGRFERVRLRTLDAGAAAFYGSLGFTPVPDEPEASHAIDPPFFVSRTRPLARGLRDLLVERAPDCAHTLAMRDHVMQLRAYLTDDVPPAEFVLAGRAVVRRGAQVLVAQNRDGRHILPGGRIEPGETAEDAAVRELLEETGWEIGDLRRLALVHLYYETPEPTDVGRVIYPDFLWQIFEATALEKRPDAKLEGDYELGGELLPMTEARDIVALPLERMLLSALHSR